MFLPAARNGHEQPADNVCRICPRNVSVAHQPCTEPCISFTLAVLQHELDVLRAAVLAQQDQIAALEKEIAAARVASGKA